jgi:hypothetical protein
MALEHAAAVCRCPTIAAHSTFRLAPTNVQRNALPPNRSPRQPSSDGLTTFREECRCCANSALNQLPAH